MLKKTALRLAATPAFVAATAGTAMAALPAGVTTEVDTYKEDALAALALILAAGVAIWGLKKLGSKLGWF